MNKRTFIKTISSAALLTTIAPTSAFSKSKHSISKKVLVLGGRGFLGPTIVKTFLKANYEVTLLNRGKTNPHLFANLPIIICDREKEDLADLKRIQSQIQDNYWDIVVDTWSKSPKAVVDFFKAFKGKFNHYHYTSSIAVYRNIYQTNITEMAPIKDLPDVPDTFELEYPYSIRKALAEKAIIESGTTFTIHRSHGMRDFNIPEPIYEPYWPVQFSRGKEILLPQQEDHYMQVTDVVSYCNFILTCANAKTTGIFNVARPRMLFKDYIKALISITGVPKKMHWISAKFLKDNGIKPYSHLPLWRPNPQGFYHINIEKALAAGLKNRPVTAMIKDQLNGYKHRNPNDDFKFGHRGTINKQEEQKVIKKWLSAN